MINESELVYPERLWPEWDADMIQHWYPLVDVEVPTFSPPLFGATMPVVDTRRSLDPWGRHPLDLWGWN